MPAASRRLERLETTFTYLRLLMAGGLRTSLSLNPRLKWQIVGLRERAGVASALRSGGSHGLAWPEWLCTADRVRDFGFFFGSYGQAAARQAPARKRPGRNQDESPGNDNGRAGARRRAANRQTRPTYQSSRQYQDQGRPVPLCFARWTQAGGCPQRIRSRPVGQDMH